MHADNGTGLTAFADTSDYGQSWKSQFGKLPVEAHEGQGLKTEEKIDRFRKFKLLHLFTNLLNTNG